MSFKLTWTHARFVVTALLCSCVFCTTLAGAQPAPVSSLNWSSFLKPVVLGQGLEIQPGQISVVNQSVDAPKAKWQNKKTTLTLLDYSSLQQTASQLNLNAWAEYQGLTASGSFSVNFSQYTAFQGNHRHWEVDALRDWTAIIPNPTLNTTAAKYVNQPTTFEGLYGNYAVTGIVYRREIQITFDAVFNQSVSGSQWSAALQASYGCFSGGGSVTDTETALNAVGQVTINITVTGPGGGTLIASGSTGDLDTLSQTVTAQLQTWDATPSDPNNAGTASVVYVTPYTAIPPVAAITPQPAPDQVRLINAIAEYAYIRNAITRLGQIQTQDTNLNPALTTYLFGKKNSHGVHVPNTGKLDEANTDLGLEYAYMQSLANNGTVSDPNINYTFADPDVVQWRVDQALWYPVTGATPGVLYIEIYSNARVAPVNITATDAARWGTRWFTNIKTVTINGTKWYEWSGSELVEGLTYTSYLDPVTGIPHRFAYIEWENPGAPCDCTLQLFSDDGSQFYNATDWNGNPAPYLFVPATSFKED